MKNNRAFIAAALILTALLLLIPAGMASASTWWQPATKCEHFPACFAGESSCTGFTPFYEINNQVISDAAKIWSLDASKIVNGQFIGFGIYGLDLTAVEVGEKAEIRLQNSAGGYIGLQATKTESGANLLTEQSVPSQSSSGLSENVDYDKLDLRLEFTRDADGEGWRVQLFSREVGTSDWDFLYRLDYGFPIDFDTAAISAYPTPPENSYSFAAIKLCRYLWIDVWSGGYRPDGVTVDTPSVGGPGMVDYGSDVFVYTCPPDAGPEMKNLVFQGWYRGHWSDDILLSRDYCYKFTATGPANLTLCANWKYVGGAASIVQGDEAASGTLSYNYDSLPKVEIDFAGAEEPGMISVTRYGSDDRPGPSGADAAGIYLSVGPQGFDGADFTIKAYYDPADLPAGLKEEELKLYRLNPDTGAWALLPEQGVNKAQHFVWAKLTGFSTFGVFASAPSPTPEPEPAPKPAPVPKTGGEPGSGSRARPLSHTDGALPFLPLAGVLILAGTSVLIIQRRLRPQR